MPKNPCLRITLNSLGRSSVPVFIILDSRAHDRTFQETDGDAEQTTLKPKEFCEESGEER